MWVPVWKYIEHTERTGRGSVGFDCHSIMLKPTLPRDCVHIDDKDGKRRTKLNTEISNKDVGTASGLM